ncbi:MAG: AlpA family transcriptional regulator [Proteobacteria bacterium]|nr:AlpA family transcriptional regulator [Pseudomonadota bacterium]
MQSQQTKAVQNVLPETGLVRLSQILGDKKKGIAPIIPVSKSSWWSGVASGRYPASIKLSERTTCWRVEDIRALIQSSGEVLSHA